MILMIRLIGKSRRSEEDFPPPVLKTLICGSLIWIIMILGVCAIDRTILWAAIVIGLLVLLTISLLKYAMVKFLNNYDNEKP